MSTIHNKKVVVKVGTNVLTQAEGLPHITAISQIVDQLAQLKKQGFHIILVSSGAVGAGKGLLGSSTEMNKVVRRQVYAAVGQIRLMNIYSELLANYGLHCAQLLATKEDFRDRSHYLNMKNCFQALLRDQIIPIVNENDVVAVSELMFTDNDELAGLIASMINAHAFIILSNVDGVYNGPPNAPDSQLIPIIESDDKKILAAISPSRSSFGRGGMSTKFRIARKAAQVGIHTYVANGRRPNILIDILNNDFVGTYFKASAQLSNVKKWIAFNKEERKGIVHINQGAEEVLCAKDRISSLLPVGITQIEGNFEKGDIIQINNPNGQAIGLGIAQYPAQTALNYLGKKGKKALIHYDYLLID